MAIRCSKHQRRVRTMPGTGGAVRRAFLKLGLAVVLGWVPAHATSIRITNDPASSSDPFICSQWNGVGDLSIVWVDDRGGTPATYFTRVNQTGTKLLGDVRVSGGIAAVSNPSCGVDSSGNTYVVWQETGSLMYSKLASSGLVVVAPLVLVAAPIDQPRVDVEPSGNAHVAWVKTSGARQVKYRKFGSTGGNIGCNELTLETATTSNTTEYPFVLAPGWGNTYAFISWHSADPTRHYLDVNVVYPDCNHLISGGPFQQTNNIVVGRSAMNDYQAGESTFLAFEGTDGSGKRHVYWLKGAGLYFPLDTGGATASRPDMAAFNDQNVLVAWEDNRYPTTHIFAQAINGTAGVPIGNNCLLSDSGAAAQHPSLARAGASTVAIVWQDDRNGLPEIYLKIQGIACDVPVPPCLDTDGNGNSDNDGDGLCDNWETGSVDFDGDSASDLNLQNYDVNKDGQVSESEKADLNVPDVYVEVDWVERHKPDLESLSNVVQTFAKHGVRLHVQLDDQLRDENGQLIPHFNLLYWREYNGNPRDPAAEDFDTLKARNFGLASERTNPTNAAGIIGAKKYLFHYGVFAHQLQLGFPTSGIGEGAPYRDASCGDKMCPGNDFVVALGQIYGDQQHNKVDGETAGFMHELGHNLGLAHGGGDEVGCKPNYLSVMNYTRQFDWYVDRKIDYSDSTLPPISLPAGDSTLSESDLDENLGIGGGSVSTGTQLTYGPGFCSVFLNECFTHNDCPFGLFSCKYPNHVSATGKVDWSQGDADSNGMRDDDLHVIANINRVPGVCDAPSGELLTGFDDWAHIRYEFQGSAFFADPPLATFSLLPSVVTYPVAEMNIDNAVAASPDDDGDGIADFIDNCPGAPNSSQADGDGDGYGEACDCAPVDSTRYPHAQEKNDGIDNQCLGDEGFGLVDEIRLITVSGGGGEEIDWSAQDGATLYSVARSTTPQFSSCSLFETSVNFLTDAVAPTPGEAFFYVVRASTPNAGSWGADSHGQARAPACQ